MSPPFRVFHIFDNPTQAFAAVKQDLHSNSIISRRNGSRLSPTSLSVNLSFCFRPRAPVLSEKAVDETTCFNLRESELSFDEMIPTRGRGRSPSPSSVLNFLFGRKVSFKEVPLRGLSHHLVLKETPGGSK